MHRLTRKGRFPLKLLNLIRGVAEPERLGEFVGRARATDVAFTYRMPSGFAGDINRTHPASIEACLIMAANPPTAYGQPVVVDPTTGGVRPIGAGDGALTDIYGITVRPYPTQQQSGGMTSGFGNAAPPTSGVIDVAKSAYVMVNVVGNPAKAGAAFVWFAATAAPHVQAGFESAATGGSTLALPAAVAVFNGAPDANGVTELIFKNP